MIKGLENVNTGMFADLLGKQVTVTISSTEGDVWHKFENIALLKLEKQKTTGMKNAPDKRIINDKASTPAMLCVCFEGGNNLVFVVGDFTLVSRYRGLSFIFPDYAVSIVEYEAA